MPFYFDTYVTSLTLYTTAYTYTSTINKILLFYIKKMHTLYRYQYFVLIYQTLSMSAHTCRLENKNIFKEHVNLLIFNIIKLFIWNLFVHQTNA